MRLYAAALIFVAWCLASVPASAADRSARLSAQRVSAPLTLDAGLSDPRWAAAPATADFTDVLAHAPAGFKTRAAVLYDDTNVYVGFWSDQAAALTINQKTDNVGLGSDDYVGIGLDPGGNGEQAYYFEVNPAGARFQVASESARYNPQWSAAAKTEDGRWTAMMVIPLRSLRIPASALQTWRLNFIRVVAAGGHQYTWGYAGQMNIGSGFPDLRDARWWPALSDVRLARRPFKARPRFELYGLESAGGNRTAFVAPDGTPFSQNPRNAGLDLSYPLTPTVSFVGAFSPDFSNVEADQLTIQPQIFRRNLTEYRPFFAQGANFINNPPTNISVNEPPNSTFYSPSIGTFDRGFKVEGTYGKYQSFGVLEARGTSEATLQQFDDVAFGWKHLLPGKTFGYWTNGVIANHGDGRDAAVEFGAEARDLRSGWVSGLFHQRETGTFVADGARAISNYGFIDHQSNTHELLVGYRDIGPLYNPIDGFTPIGDVRGLVGSLNLFGSLPQLGVKNGNVNATADRYLDRTGAVHKADANIALNADFKNLFSLHLSSGQTEVRSYDGNFYTGYPFYRNPLDQRFDVTYIGLGYGEQSPRPITAQYSWGPFGAYYLQQITSNMTLPFGGRYTISLEYDGTREKRFTGPADGQWLRRATFGWSIDKDTNVSLALRDISGRGGFANPGTNFSGSLHKRFHGGNELYLNFGTPAATRTLNRTILKYVIKTGTESGT